MFVVVARSKTFLSVVGLAVARVKHVQSPESCCLSRARFTTCRIRRLLSLLTRDAAVKPKPDILQSRAIAARSIRLHLVIYLTFAAATLTSVCTGKGKGSPYLIAERRVPELIPVLGSQPAGEVSHKSGGRLPLLSARPAVTLATLKRAATNFAA